MNLLVRPGDVITLQPSPAQFLYLSGEVKSPGEKTFRRGLTLTQAIIAAGGLSKNAKEARIARDNGKGFLVVSRYKLKDIDSGKVPDPVVQPGDRITIE
jgi:protein involved in polysaccharide export with SLBB domain